MSEIIKGTCGNCGGPVTVPQPWYATVPPIPTCSRCGATKAYPYGPVVPMREPTITKADGWEGF